MHKLYNLYDSLPEPARFLTFLSIAMPGIILLGFEKVMDNPWFFFAGFTYLVILGLTRFYHLATKEKSKKPKRRMP